jgi:hypothetical protein
MELNIAERLTLLGILPKEGNFLTLKILRKLREELSFSEEELKKYQITQDGEQIHWNSEKDKKEPKDFKISGELLAVIVKSLKELDASGKLTINHYSLYEKFVESESK